MTRIGRSLPAGPLVPTVLFLSRSAYFGVPARDIGAHLKRIIGDLTDLSNPQRSVGHSHIPSRRKRSI